jgi:hypothetical protein
MMTKPKSARLHDQEVSGTAAVQGAIRREDKKRPGSKELLLLLTLIKLA